MKALSEIGFFNAIKYAFFELFHYFLNLMIFPPLKNFFLRLFGAKIGRNSILLKCKFINIYRGGFSSFKVKNNCFIGEDVILDLADNIEIGNNVSFGPRAIVLTHTNVGYKNHPLQKYFPSKNLPVRIDDNCFIGANAIILPGITIEKNSFIAAGAIVTKNVPKNSLVIGTKIKKIKK